MISRRALLALPAFAAASCSRPEPQSSGYAFIANQGGGSVAAVDLDVMAVAKHITLDGAPSQVLAARTRSTVYALTPTTGSVHEIASDSLKVARRFALGAAADFIHLADNEATLYAVARTNQELLAINTTDGKIAWKLHLPEAPIDVAFSRDGVTAAITSASTLRLLSLPARSLGEPLGRANYGAVRFLFNGERLVAADLEARQISVYRIANPRLVTHLPIAVRPENLAFNRDGGQLFVTGSGADSVVVVYPYDVPEVAETILVGHQPAMMTSSQSLLFITNPTSGSVSVLHVGSHKVIAVVPVGINPGQVAVTPDDQFALVLNRDSGSVTVLNIDGIQPNKFKSAPLVTVIPVGSFPVSAALRGV